MLHVFLLIINLAGAQVGVARGPTEYATAAECEPHLIPSIVVVQSMLDNSPNPAVHGQFAVADGKCMTDEQAAADHPFEQ